MQDWFHDILNHLYYSYPLDHTWRDINNYLINDLHVQPTHPGHMISLSAILHVLREKGYIDGFPQPPATEIRRGNVIGVNVQGYSTPNDLTTHRISIRLTLTGYDYVQDRERLKEQHDSILRTNISIRRINKWFWVTIVALVLGALFQGIGVWQNYQKNNEQKYPPAQSLKPEPSQIYPDTSKIHTPPLKMKNDSSRKK
jgi:hypothetical protein